MRGDVETCARAREVRAPAKPSSPRLSGEEEAARLFLTAARAPCNSGTVQQSCASAASSSIWSFAAIQPWQDALRGCRPSEAPWRSGAAETSRARPVPPARCCRRRVGRARRRPQAAPPIRSRCLQAQATVEARLHRPGVSAPASQDLSSGRFGSARPGRLRVRRPRSGSKRYRESE